MVGVPSIVMVGGSDVLVLTRDRGRRKSIVRSLIEADAVVTVSRDLKQRTVELGVPAERVHVVYRGVDRERFSPGATSVARKSLGIDVDRPLLLWVGRMEPVKGLDVLLGACVELKNQGLGFQLSLIGDGTCRAAHERQSQRAGLGDRITFRGAVEQSELAAWYRAADLTVLPSHSEGVPNVLLESICCGTPFVASHVGGIREIADPRHDTLVPPGDPEALAAAIAGALTRERTSTSREFLPLSWDDSAEALSAVIARQVARGRPFATASAAARRSVSASGVRQLIRRGLAATMPSNRFLVRGPRDSGQIFLTFDDGPHPEHTPRLLDVLAELNVKATFFVVGRQVEQHPDIVRRIHAEGHALGNHTYFHFAPTEIGTRDFLREVERCGRLVEEITGQSCELVRPPQGKLTLGKLTGLWRARKAVVLWNVDPKDYSRHSSRELCQWFARRALDAGDIVLLHDCYSYASGAVPELVDLARGCGLGIGPIHEALHSRADYLKNQARRSLFYQRQEHEIP
jgi:peptidoglycan/xylan/chitin deacetylase (PgdA/CDA1 family)